MKCFQQLAGSRLDVFPESSLLVQLDRDDLSEAQKKTIREILALEVNASLTIPSGAAVWTRVPDDTPTGLHAIVCGSRRTSKPCKYCSAPHTKLCDYPVTRDGKAGTCDIPMCNTCTTKGGRDIDYCRPHAKIVKNAKTSALPPAVQP